jgi:hypothetical protein
LPALNETAKKMETMNTSAGRGAWYSFVFMGIAAVLTACAAKPEPSEQHSTASTAFGNNAAALAVDERVRSRLNEQWLTSLSGSMNTYPEGNINDVFASVSALFTAGVDILAGSDVSEPVPGLGGLAHGASPHHELQMLVAAGLEPIEALRAATSVLAQRFGLSDRGHIAPGMRADLLLVAGDPLMNISDTLSIITVWRGGIALDAQN